jgi:hypothetical protein
VIRVAQEHFHGLGIEPSGDLLGGCDREAFAGNFSKAATLKFVLQGFALSFGAPLSIASAWPIEIHLLPGSLFSDNR